MLVKAFLFAGLFVSLLLFGCLGESALSASPEPTLVPTATPLPITGVSDEVSAAVSGIDGILGYAVSNDTLGIDDELNITDEDLGA